MQTDLSVTIELIESTSMQTIVSLYSFIEKNKWFKGKVYLLSSNKNSISTKTLDEITAIYEDVEVLPVFNDSKLAPITSLIKQSENLRISLLKLGSLLIKDRVLHISKNSIFFNDISFILDRADAVFSQSFTADSSSVFYLNAAVNKSKILEEIIDELSDSSDKVIKRKVDSIFSNALVSSGCSVSVLSDKEFESSSIFIDRYFNKLKSKMSSLSCLHLDEKSFNNPLYTKVNQIWLQQARYIKMILSMPRKRTSEFQKKKIQIESERAALRIARSGMTDIRKKGTWDPTPYDRSSIEGLSITITTMIWKRHHIFELWANSILRLKNEFKEVEINVVVAGSEGEVSKNIVEKYGFEYIEVPNSPLGRKSNARLKAAKKYNSDYVMLIGSDDLLSTNMFFVILCKMAEKYDEIAALDIYYYDTVSKIATFSHGYQGKISGSPIAPGRTLSKGLLDSVKWQLWSNKENAFLDNWVKEKVNSKKKNHYYFSSRELGVMMCDVKSETNMTEFKLRFNHEKIAASEIVKHIPELKKMIEG